MVVFAFAESDWVTDLSGFVEFDVGPELRLTIRLYGALQATLAFPALTGRRYVMESSATVPSASWTQVAGEILGFGTNMTVVVGPLATNSSTVSGRCLNGCQGILLSGELVMIISHNSPPCAPGFLRPKVAAFGRVQARPTGNGRCTNGAQGAELLGGEPFGHHTPPESLGGSRQRELEEMQVVELQMPSASFWRYSMASCSSPGHCCSLSGRPNTSAAARMAASRAGSSFESRRLGSFHLRSLVMGKEKAPHRGLWMASIFGRRR